VERPESGPEDSGEQADAAGVQRKQRPPPTAYTQANSTSREQFKRCLASIEGVLERAADRYEPLHEAGDWRILFGGQAIFGFFLLECVDGAAPTIGLLGEDALPASKAQRIKSALMKMALAVHSGGLEMRVRRHAGTPSRNCGTDVWPTCLCVHVS
jgi:hypothetical protein